MVVCGVDFNVEVDGLFVVAYGVVVCGFDFNMEVDGLFVVAYGVLVSGLDLKWRCIEVFFCWSIWDSGVRG